MEDMSDYAGTNDQHASAVKESLQTPNKTSVSRINSSTDFNSVFHPLQLDDFLDNYADVETNGDYSFTGVWHSARGLLKYLCNRNDVKGNILELGAGTGWLGINLACHLGRECRKMTLTDRQSEWLSANVEAARRQGIPCVSVVSQEMDWRSTASVHNVAAMGWDWIIGSDLIYSNEGVRDLARVLAILLSRGSGKVLYAHTAGRMPDLDGLWEDELQRNGLAWVVQAKLPVTNADGTVWEGRNTLVMEIYSTSD